jgi:hypothetical protein
MEMRKSLLLTAILLMTIAGPIYADDYSITLYDPINTTQVDGTGSFTFNDPWFPAFTLTYAGLTFDLVADGINYPMDLGLESGPEALGALADYPWYSETISDPDGDSTIIYLGGISGVNVLDANGHATGVLDTQLAGDCTFFQGVTAVTSCTGGSVVIADLSPLVMAPEPSAIILLLSVLCGVCQLLSRKRQKNRDVHDAAV